MAANRPLYIFDLDGTLALIQHRRHFVEGPNKDWRAFFYACVDDAPNLPLISTLRRLHYAGADVWIWSGRSDEVRLETEEWLYRHSVGGPHPMKMRTAGDHQPDVTLKRGWLHAMSPTDRQRLVAVFDDRTRLVDMWRSEGVTCFQVAEGDF
jgi:hypothetical protein